MKVYLVKQVNVEDFKNCAKKEIKAQEIEFYARTSDALIEKTKAAAIRDCRRWNKIYKKRLKAIQYFTEIHLYE